MLQKGKARAKGNDEARYDAAGMKVKHLLTFWLGLVALAAVVAAALHRAPSPSISHASSEYQSGATTTQTGSSSIESSSAVQSDSWAKSTSKANAVRATIPPRHASDSNVVLARFAAAPSAQELRQQLTPLLPTSPSAKFVLGNMIVGCSDFVAGGGAPPPPPRLFNTAVYGSEFARAQEVFRRRCTGLTYSDLDEGRRLIQQAAAENDPAAKAWTFYRQWLSNEPPSDAIAQLAGLAMSGDPFALFELALAYGAVTEKRRDLQFGVPAERYSSELVRAAFWLAACDAGLPCGKDSLPVVSACLIGLSCTAGDVLDLFRTFGLPPADFERATHLRDVIGQAIKTGDTRLLGTR